METGFYFFFNNVVPESVRHLTVLGKKFLLRMCESVVSSPHSPNLQGIFSGFPLQNSTQIQARERQFVVLFLS